MRGVVRTGTRGSGEYDAVIPGRDKSRFKHGENHTPDDLEVLVKFSLRDLAGNFGVGSIATDDSRVELIFLCQFFYFENVSQYPIGIPPYSILNVQLRSILQLQKCEFESNSHNQLPSCTF